MASMAAFVHFWSSAYEVSGGCGTDTLNPSFLRILAPASQPEPSAKAPCTRTTFLICCFTTILLCGKDSFGPIDFRRRAPRRETAPVLRAGRKSHLQLKADRPLVCVCGGGRLFNQLDCFLRMRHVRHVAGAAHFDRLGMGALRHHPFLDR